MTAMLWRPLLAPNILKASHPNRRTFSCRPLVSALYIVGRKATEWPSVVRPHVEFIEKLNRRLMARSIRKRQCKISLRQVQNCWRFYRLLAAQFDHLKQVAATVSEHLVKLGEDPVHNQMEINRMTVRYEAFMDEYRSFNDYKQQVEEIACLGVLSLPNLLHPRTPLHNTQHSQPPPPPTVHFEYLCRPAKCQTSHMQLGSGNIIANNSYFTFLLGEAALFEYALSNYVHAQLLTLNYTPFSSPDLCRSVIVEGCGHVDYLSGQHGFVLQEKRTSNLSRLHLVGSASIYAFMSYFAKGIFSKEQFPVTSFCIGRRYNQPHERHNAISGNALSLFDLKQETAVQLFIAYLDRTETDRRLDEVVEHVQMLYSSLNYHFRVVVVPASQLQPYESLKYSIQMYSNHLERYLDVGNVVYYDTYLSKRLLYLGPLKAKQFPKVITCSLLSIQKFLGCALENNAVTGKKLICEQLNQYSV